MLNKQYILDYLKTHNQINDKNRVVIENIIDCASEFSPNYLESVQFIRCVIFGRKAQVPDCLFLSERECKVLYALCRIGCVDSVLNPILCKRGQELPEDVEDILRLYDDTGKEIIFDKDGKCTSWAETKAWPQMVDDIWNIHYKFIEDWPFNPDEIEGKLDEIVRLGF